MTRFKTVVPLMIYVYPTEAEKLKKFAKRAKKTVSQVAREGIAMRMNKKDPYNTGFDEGLRTAMNVAVKTEGAQMRFPSGKSFGQLVWDEIEKFKREMPDDPSEVEAQPEAEDDRQQ